MYNVLIVDDEPIICEGMCKIIDWNDYGFNIIDIAGNGREALGKIKNDGIDLVITDVRMPAMDGIELCRQIKQYNESIEIIIISGYNDFEYARKAIEYNVKAYLLKPVMPNELVEQLLCIRHELDRKLELEQEEKMKKKILRDRLLYEFVSGYVDVEQRKEELEKYGIDLSNCLYNIVMIRIDDFYYMVEDNINAKPLKHNVRDIIEEFARQHRLGHVYEEINGMFGILILDQSSYDGDINSLHTKLETISSIIKRDLGISVTIGYGTYKTKLSDIKISRREALQLLEGGIFDGRKKVISYYEFADRGEELWNLKWDKDLFLRAVERMDEESIQNQIDDLIKNIVSNRITKDIIKSMLISIAWDLSVLIQKYNGSANEIFGYNILDTIDNICNNVDMLGDWIIEMSRKIHSYIMELRSQGSKSLIDRVVEYVDDNYCNDIKLSQIADDFYVNYAYLGQLFKDNTGVSFSSYINKKRIEKAKQLYMTGDFKIYEIIEKVGYKHSEYFYRQFKKCEGITFAEFRTELERERGYEC